VAADPAVDTDKPATPRAVTDETPGLHNVLLVGRGIYSGSEPHGKEGFETLKLLGIKTVVSVDGARPNLEAAKQAGVNNYIVKPFNAETLKSKIEAVFGVTTLAAG
jgi:hypothetical protein